MDNSSFNRNSHVKIVLMFFITIWGALFLIWRAPFGYCFPDEPFAISLAHRFSMGDGLISDEWNNAQNIGVLLLPFLKLRQLFCNNTEGIILYFRYVYVFLWFTTCHFVYLSQKKSGFTVGLLCFILLILFTPADLMICSYVSFSLISFIHIALLVSMFDSVEDAANNKPALLCIGVLLASLVLCCPYCVVFFIFFCIFCFVSRNKYVGLHIVWTWVCIGIGLMVLFYCILLRNTDFSIFIKSLEMMIPGNGQSLFVSSKRFIRIIFQFKSSFVFLLISIVALLDKKCRSHRLTYIGICSVAWLYHIIQLCFSEDVAFNIHMLSFSLIGGVCFILLDNKPKKSLYIWYLPGWFFAFIWNIASNTAGMAVSIGMTVCDIASVHFLWLLLNELRFQYSVKIFLRAISSICIIGVLVFQISTELHFRFTRTCFDAPLYELNYLLQSGSAKGIKTSKDNCNNYTELSRDLDSLPIGKNSNHYFLNCSSNPWVYLSVDLPYGTYSSWTYNKFEDTEAILREWYEVHPDSIPRYILEAYPTPFDWRLVLNSDDYYSVPGNFSTLYIRK